ncbi:dual specificity protein phosphatase 10-like [Gigantopelta aegis]|uniref:dual specificity protein phosphatase 10-like n=1 Tax=Gigantopelta aegis TaxID=1735272 RepID=UPI001B88A409|nr:dual specificity protein phosphatase 10-like [Gigantopelta aegis]
MWESGCLCLRELSSGVYESFSFVYIIFLILLPRRGIYSSDITTCFLMVWSWFRWFKSSIFVDTISPEPMPASGEVEVLRPTSFAHQTLPDRRKIELKLDFSSLGSPQGVAPEDCYHIRKKCKLDSMSVASAFSSSKKSCLTARTMSPHELASKLSKSKPVLVLDCRPFLAYNRHHIQGAVNVSCADKISRKRLEQGKLNIADFISSTEAKDVLKKRTQIVIYDEHTTDLKEVALDNGLNFVLSVLLREGKEAFVLKGGLKDFSHKHNDLCMSSLKDLSNKHNDLCMTSMRCPGFSRPLYSPTGQPIHEPDAEIEQAITSQILPFLYLGNERDAASLDCLMNNKINYILNVTSHVPLHFEKNGIKYKRLPANDSCQQNLKQYFEEAIEFIDDCHQNGGKILIHCHAGVSRSATITIAYILKHTKMTMTDAYKYVKGKRAIISPNFNFMGQLMEFERDLNKGETPRILNPRLQGVESTV